MILNIFFNFMNLFGDQYTSLDLICVVFLMCLIRYLQQRYKLRKIYKFASEFAGPKSVPGFGNELMFLIKDRDIFRSILKYSSIYGSHFRLWLNNHLFIVISSTEDVKDILLSPKLLSKGKLFENEFSKYFGNGLFTADVHTWKMKRKLLVFPTKKNVLSNYSADMNKLTDQWIAQLKYRNKIGKELDAWEFLPWLPFNIFCKTMLDLPTDEDITTERPNTLTKSGSLGLALSFQKLFIPKAYSKLFTDIMMRKTSNEAANDLAVNYFRIKSQEARANKKNLHNSDDTFQKFIDYMKKSDFSEQDRKDEITTWTAGGTETMSVTMCFILLMVAMHQDVQDKVYDELISVLGKSSTTEVDTKEVEKLIYLEQVIYETLRYFPLTPFLMRYVAADTKIGKYVYPAGTYLLMNFYGIHHDPNNYEKPEAFNPDHFSPEKRETLPKGAFLPFSIGPRDCIGKAYAILQMKIVMAKFLRAFHITTKMKKDDINLVCKFVLTNSTGFKICLTERN